MGSCDIPHKIWAWSGQEFWRFLDTKKQTSRQLQSIFYRKTKFSLLQRTNHGQPNFRVRSTFPVPVCTVSPGQTLRLLFLKGQRCVQMHFESQNQTKNISVGLPKYNRGSWVMIGQTNRHPEKLYTYRWWNINTVVKEFTFIFELSSLNLWETEMKVYIKLFKFSH